VSINHTGFHGLIFNYKATHQLKMFTDCRLVVSFPRPSLIQTSRCFRWTSVLHHQANTAASQQTMTDWFHSISTSSFFITLLFDIYRWESVVKKLNVITNYVLKLPRRHSSITFRANMAVSWSESPDGSEPPSPHSGDGIGFHNVCRGCQPEILFSHKLLTLPKQGKILFIYLRSSKTHLFFYITWLIFLIHTNRIESNSKWVRALSVPMHVGFSDRTLCPLI
jgi:hypothetical protein